MAKDIIFTEIKYLKNEKNIINFTLRDRSVTPALTELKTKQLLKASIYIVYVKMDGAILLIKQWSINFARKYQTLNIQEKYQSKVMNNRIENNFYPKKDTPKII